MTIIKRTYTKYELDNEILKHVLLRKGAENWFIKDKVKMYWLILLLWLGTNKGLQYDITSHSMPYLKDTCQINKEAFFFNQCFKYRNICI